MSYWDELDLEAKITAILADVHYHRPHHFGRLFLTAYQLAIAFAERYPDETRRLGYPIGGQGTGQHNSLAQYLAKELSSRIRDGRLPGIQGAFLSKDAHLEVRFRTAADDEIRSSLTDLFDLSMFRLMDD